MPDERFKEQYKNIKAPDELYSRIMNAEFSSVKKKKAPVISIAGSIAASVAVIFIAAFGFFGNPASPVIFAGEEKLTGEVVLTEDDSADIMLLRSTGEISCNFTVELKENSLVEISEGFLFDENGNILIDSQQGKEFSEKLTCCWTVFNADTEKQYEMKLSDKNGIYIITMSFDSTLGKWTVGLTK